MYKVFRIIFALQMVIFFLGCQAKTTANAAKDSIQPKTAQLLIHDTSIRILDLEFLVLIPRNEANAKGDLLLLPGWDYSNTKWCDSTNVCETALQMGYRVIAPQMGRSVYATRYYPQTRKDFLKFPTLSQLDSALELLKTQYGFFTQKNLILGLSTGARGVALLCERKPDWFHAAAVLSGDYNQTTMPNDNLMRYTYGPYSLYRILWTKTDNPQTDAIKLKTPIYLGHGMKDKVVPFGQTKNFAAVLQKNTTNSNAIKVNLEKNAGHDFSYWRSELPAIWQFFENHMK